MAAGFLCGIEMTVGTYIVSYFGQFTSIILDVLFGLGLICFAAELATVMGVVGIDVADAFVVVYKIIKDTGLFAC
jgi:hypothetical protein